MPIQVPIKQEQHCLLLLCMSVKRFDKGYNTQRLPYTGSRAHYLFMLHPVLIDISYSLWSLILTTLFSVTSGNFSAIHVDYVDFVPELGWQFQSHNL